MSNVKNNKKYQQTEKQICLTFLELLEERRLSEISITEVCARAGITRATFYAHCRDLKELMSKTDQMLSQDLVALLYEYNHSHQRQWDIHYCFTLLFEHVKKHRKFYRIFISHVPIFPLFSVLPDFYQQLSGENIFQKSHLGDVDERKLQFHSAFFYAGMTAFLRIWLESDCKESVEEMMDLVNQQYHYQGQPFYSLDLLLASGAIPGAEQ